MCASENLTKIINLGFHPLADFFPKERQLHEMERRYPLSVILCGECGHTMNSYVVPPETRYQENDYSYDSGNSKVAIQHFADMAQNVSNHAGVVPGDLVVDIGSNVGTLLSAFKNLGANILGVEPAGNIADMAEKNGIPTIRDFFNSSACAEILKKGKVKAITITNAFNHIADLNEFMKCIVSVLRDDGTLVIEVPYFLQLLKRMHFDTIYLEHVSYISLKPLRRLFKKFGLAITHFEENDYMSSSIRIFVGYGPESHELEKQIALEEEAGLFNPRTYEEFSRKIRNCKLALLKDLVNVRAKGGKIAAIGAAAKGNTFLNYCGIDTELIDFATDASPLKIGKYTPGSHLPIFSDDAIDDSVTHALILPWNIADFLKSKISPKHPKLEFITPHIES